MRNKIYSTADYRKMIKVLTMVFVYYAILSVLTTLGLWVIHITDQHKIISLRAEKQTLRAELHVKDSLLGKSSFYTEPKYLIKKQ